MSNPDFVDMEELPHVSDYMERAGADQFEAADRVGEMMERTSREPSPQRPLTDPVPHGFDAPLDAEDARSDDDKLEDGLDRIFGAEEPQKVVKPAPAPAVEEPKPEPALNPADVANEPMWSVAEVDFITQSERHRQQLEQLESLYHDGLARAEQMPESNERADLLYKLGLLAHDITERRDTLNRAVDGIRQSYEARQKTRAMQYRAQETEKLKKALPDFDAAKARSYAQSYGYDDAQINSLIDHREIVILDKARRWDEYQAQSKKKIAGRIVPKGAERKSSDRAKLQRAQRNGDYDGIDGALDRRLSEIFR